MHLQYYIDTYEWKFSIIGDTSYTVEIKGVGLQIAVGCKLKIYIYIY